MSIHRRIAAVGLVLGPFIFALGDLFRRMVDHSNGSTTQVIIKAINAHPGTWQLAAFLSLVGAALTFPGVVAAIGLVRGRGGVLTGIGGYLFGLGLLASVGHMVESFGFYGMAARSALSMRDIVTFDNTGYPVLGVVIALFILGIVAGQLLFVIGLRRARVLPLWAVVACIVNIVTGSTGGVLAGVVGVVAWVATYAPVARILFSQESITAVPSGPSLETTPVANRV